MSMVDPYDLPAKMPTETIEAMARDLLRGKQRTLFILAAMLVGCGLLHGHIEKSVSILPRYGALMCALSIVHAYRQLRWDRMTDKIDMVLLSVFTSVELDKLGNDESQRNRAIATAHKRTQRVLPKFYQIIQRTFVAQHLIVAFVGNLIWAFGDFVPLDRIS